MSKRKARLRREPVAGILFAVSVRAPDGASCEVTVVDGDVVYCTSCGKGGRRAYTDEVQRRRRDIDSFLGAVDALGLTGWDQHYGDPSVTDRWHVVLDVAGRMTRWRGSDEYPPNWDELCDLVEKLTERPLG